MLNLFCFFFGHRLGVFRYDPRRAWVLGHIYTLAGFDCVCFRCGMRSNDARPEAPPAPAHPYRSPPC